MPDPALPKASLDTQNIYKVAKSKPSTTNAATKSTKLNMCMNCYTRKTITMPYDVL